MMQTAVMDLCHMWRFVVSGMDRGYAMLRGMFYRNRENLHHRKTTSATVVNDANAHVR